MNTTNEHGRTPKTDLYGYWMPSYCPVGLPQATDRRHVMVEAEAVTWGGGPRCTTDYRCPNCGHAWTEDWPVIMSPYADEYRQQRRRVA